MKIQVNGQQKEFEQNDLTVLQLLKLMNVTIPQMVSVELNGQILEQSEYETKILKDSDVVEFLFFMGGGRL